MADINIDGIVTWLGSWFQEKLVSGTNIKTINNQSLLGGGNISISGGGGGLSIDDVYPIGAIYMSVNSTSPATLFGGTWVQLKDRFLLGAGDTYSNGSTGGASTVSLTQSQMPRHTHAQNAHSHNMGYRDKYAITGGARGVLQYGATASEGNASSNSVTATNKYTGGTGSSESASNGSAHENMPPYLAVYMWKRTA